MAHAIITQKIMDDDKTKIVKITIKGDGASGELSKTTLFNAAAHLDQDTFRFAGLNDATFSGTFTGAQKISYKVQVDSVGATDTFRWSDNDGASWNASSVAMTGAPQNLNNGVQVTFGATTGHTLHDFWQCAAIPIMTDNKLMEVEYCLNNFSAELFWHATSDVAMMSLAKDHPVNHSFYEVGGLVNNSGAGKTGNILISTLGLAASTYNGYILLKIFGR